MRHMSNMARLSHSLVYFFKDTTVNMEKKTLCFKETGVVLSKLDAGSTEDFKTDSMTT